MSSTGPLAIATAVTDSGVYCYTKMADGTVIAEYNPTTEKQVEAAQQSGDVVTMQEIKPWHRQQTTYKCDPASGLCAFTLNGTVALFHESEGQVKYWLDEHLPGGTNQPNSTSASLAERFPVPEPADSQYTCMHGTEIAVSGNSDGSELTLFYQDKDGYLCYRFAKAMIWDEPVRICKAVKGTGIAAVGWSQNQNIRVYYQDENYVLNEYCLFKGKLAAGARNLADPKALTSIAVVYWNSDLTQKTELRVYFQIGQSGIHERCWSSAANKWDGDLVLYDAFVAQFNVIAFVRGKAGSPVINLWIASKEGRVLLQRAYNRSNAWIPAVGYGIPRTDYAD
ncbi:hypothetical protein BC835DRAFT_1422420 [Cytidiella melzeri]|nr:hypothetical protein BC835DRAFT_1422420 [Cytidiella melzeri]